MCKSLGLFIIILISILFFKNKIIEKFQSNTEESESSAPTYYPPMYYNTDIPEFNSTNPDLNLGLFKQVPFSNGSKEIIDSIDYGVNRNVRLINNFNSYTEEISYFQMNRILEEILFYNIHKIQLSGNKNNVKTNYLKIFSLIVKLINLHFNKLKYQNIHHKDDKRIYRLIDYEIIEDKQIDNNDKKLFCLLQVYKEKKEISFNIQFEIIYNTLIGKVELKNCMVIGINIQDKLTFSPDFNQEFCNLEKYEFYKRNPEKYKSKLIRCHNEPFYDQDDINTFLKNKEVEKKKSEELKKYKCFLKDGFTEETCLSYSPKENKVGYWDNPCKKNTDCPFYKANKNYDNNRGGCIDGFCEMPLNLKRVGYKSYDKTDKPFCNNCDLDNCLGTDCYTCCDLQSNKNKYPNLKTPDYSFENDGR